jgi:hypothetical protein
MLFYDPFLDTLAAMVCGLIIALLIPIRRNT